MTTFYQNAKVEEIPEQRVIVIGISQLYAWLDQINGEVERLERIREQLIADINAVAESKEPLDPKAIAAEISCVLMEEPDKPFEDIANAVPSYVDMKPTIITDVKPLPVEGGDVIAITKERLP